MPYTRSRGAVQRVEPILRELLTATDDVIYQSLEPQKLSYQLHEALKSAGIYPEYAHYSALRDKFTIRLRAGKVVAEIKHRPLVALKVVTDPHSKMTIPEVNTVLGIVGAAVTHKAGEIYFPDAKLDESNLLTLSGWATPAGYFIINNYDNGVTLTKTDPGVVSWTPSGNGGPSD